MKSDLETEVDGQSVNLLRRSIDYSFVDRLASLEERSKVNTETLKQVQIELSNLHKLSSTIIPKLDSIDDFESTFQAGMESIKKIMFIGILLKWLILTTVGFFASIGTVITTLELIKKWSS